MYLGGENRRDNLVDIKWIKIVTDIFDDEKILLIETLPEADSIIVIWFKLLCLAGKQNNSGVFVMNNRMPYNKTMFATIFRRKETIVELALKTFEQFGMIEIIGDTVTIPNWGKHQNFDKIEQKNGYMRDYMKGYRVKQKLLVESKANGKTNSKANVSEVEKIREDKIRKDKKEIYGTFGNVKLTPKEFETLIEEHGQERTNKAIEFLSSYREEKGYKNKSDYLSIKRWVFEAADKKTFKSGNPFKDAYMRECENEQKRSDLLDGDNQNVLPRILPPDIGD